MSMVFQRESRRVDFDGALEGSLWVKLPPADAAGLLLRPFSQPFL